MRAHALRQLSFGEGSNVLIIRNSTPEVWTELLYSTAVIFQYRVFPASEARVLSESICVSQNTHVGLMFSRHVL